MKFIVLCLRGEAEGLFCLFICVLGCARVAGVKSHLYTDTFASGDDYLQLLDQGEQRCKYHNTTPEWLLLFDKLVHTTLPDYRMICVAQSVVYLLI